MYKHNINPKNPLLENRKLPIPIHHELLKSLLYFGIFQYPLTQKELKRFCGTFTTSEEIGLELDFLEKGGYVKQKAGFYSTGDRNLDSMVERRLKGSIKAEQMLKMARWYSKLISYFPFVMGISLSGSLSKGYADEKSDVDYFIITEPGRLWLCRMLLVLFKRVFLFNSHKYFCVNYFIDTQNLEMEDKNIFTATELATLIPTSNTLLHRKLMQANPWVKDFFPNTLLESVSGEVISANNSMVKRLIEKIFQGKLGDNLDDYCFKVTISKWKKKFKNFSDTEFELNLRSKKDVSKHHPRGFQLKVLNALDERVKGFEDKFNVRIFRNG